MSLERGEKEFGKIDDSSKKLEKLCKQSTRTPDARKTNHLSRSDTICQKFDTLYTIEIQKVFHTLYSIVDSR